MAQYLDFYFLIDNRESFLIKEILYKHMPMCEESQNEYPVPIYSDNPDIIFTEVDELILYLEMKSNCDYIIYWQSLDLNSIIQHFIVQFTNDGKMIFGFSVYGNNPNDKFILKLYNDLKKNLKSNVGCITSEEPPPSNSIEFLDFVKKRISP